MNQNHHLSRQAHFGCYSLMLNVKMMYGTSYCYLLLLLFCFIANGQRNITAPSVALQFNETTIPNNSYLLYENMENARRGEGARVFCTTNKIDCCNFVPNSEGDWYLPNGERILGGFEYPNIQNYFARSRGIKNIGLYRQSYPPQRGRFYCELPDSDGTNHTLFVNIVDEIPVITSQPAPHSTLKGDRATFTIDLSFAGNSTYQWQKNNMDITEEAGHYQGTTTPNLTLINVQEEDEGEYRCVVDDYLISCAAQLSVETVATLLHYQKTIIAAVVSVGLLLSLSTLACLLIFYVLRKNHLNRQHNNIMNMDENIAYNKLTEVNDRHLIMKEDKSVDDYHYEEIADAFPRNS